MPVISEIKLENANTDVGTLEQFVNGESATLTSRLGASYKNLKKIELDIANSLSVSLAQGLLPLDKYGNRTLGHELVNNVYFEVAGGGAYKPVYRRTLFFASLPNAGISTVSIGYNVNLMEPLSMKITGIAQLGTTETRPLPFNNGANSISIYHAGANIGVQTNFDASAFSARVEVTYSIASNSTVASPVGIAGPIVVQNQKYFSGTETLLIGQYWETSSGMKRPMYQKIIKVAALGNNTTVFAAHGLNFADVIRSSVEFEGQMTDGSNMLRLGDTTNSALGAAIGVHISGTNINLKSTDDKTTYSAWVRIRYCKTADSEIAI